VTAAPCSGVNSRFILPCVCSRFRAAPPPEASAPEAFASGIECLLVPTVRVQCNPPDVLVYSADAKSKQSWKRQAQCLKVLSLRA
jgi:hypothetical protein